MIFFSKRFCDPGALYMNVKVCLLGQIQQLAILAEDCQQLLRPLRNFQKCLIREWGVFGSGNDHS